MSRHKWDVLADPEDCSVGIRPVPEGGTRYWIHASECMSLCDAILTAAKKVLEAPDRRTGSPDRRATSYGERRTGNGWGRRKDDQEVPK